MNRLIITSNRLPVKIDKSENKLKLSSSAGGLATGLKLYHKGSDSLWIGWPGIIPETDTEAEKLKTLLEKEQCLTFF